MSKRSSAKQQWIVFCSAAVTNFSTLEMMHNHFPQILIVTTSVLLTMHLHESFLCL